MRSLSVCATKASNIFSACPAKVTSPSSTGLYNFPEVKLITNRQEGCAAFMAEGYAKATRTPGVCLVTRGPGATSASIAVHSAKYDSAPLVLLVGQVGRNARGREAGQEIGLRTILRQHRQMGDRDQRSETDPAHHEPRLSHRAHRPARPGGRVAAARRHRNRHGHHDDRPASGGQAQSRSGGRRNFGRTHQCGAQTGAADRFGHSIFERLERSDRFCRKVSAPGADLVQTPRRISQQSSELRRQYVDVEQARAKPRLRRKRSFDRPRQPAEPAEYCRLHFAAARHVRLSRSTPTKKTSARIRGPRSASSPMRSKFLLAALKHPAPRPNESRASWIAEQHAAQKHSARPKSVRRPKSPWNES